VAKDFASWVRAQHAPYLIKEAALLFETGSYKELDTVILVTAPLETRIARTRQRDPQRSAQQIRNIISKQIKEEEAIPLADEVIYNDGRQLVIPQVIQLDSKIKRAIR
jgi:dephospho-CoA kinase